MIRLRDETARRLGVEVMKRGMVLPLTGARSLGKIRGSWNGTGEPIFALIFNQL